MAIKIYCDFLKYMFLEIILTLLQLKMQNVRINNLQILKNNSNKNFCAQRHTIIVPCLSLKVITTRYNKN